MTLVNETWVWGIGGIMLTGKNWSSERQKPVSLSLYPQQITNGLRQEQTHVCAVTNSQLSATPRHGPLICSQLNVTLRDIPVTNPNTVYILQQALTSGTCGDWFASSGTWLVGHTRMVFTHCKRNIFNSSNARRNVCNEQNPNSCTFKVVRNLLWNKTQDMTLRNLRYKNIHASLKDNYNLPDT
jgi:hypothetical protein